jgi:hypothetical protein
MIGKIALAGAFAAVAVLASCGNDSALTPQLRGQTSITTGDTALQVFGRYFDGSTVVFWDGKPQTTKFVDSQNLNVEVDPSLTLVATTAKLTAENAGGLLSAPVDVFVFDGTLSATSVEPETVPLGAGSATLTVKGTGFRPVTQALWDGQALATTFVSSRVITADVPAALLLDAGDVQVQVKDPSCVPTVFSPCAVPSQPFIVEIGPSTRSSVQANATDLASDEANGLLYFAQGLTSPGIATVDPVRATTSGITSGAFAFQVPRLAISDDDQALYVTDDFTDQLSRFPLPSLQGPTRFPVVAGRPLVDFAILPGLSQVVAVNVNGIAAILDGNVLRPNQVTQQDLGSIAWGFDASTLFGALQFGPGIVRFQVDASGVNSASVLGSAVFGHGFGDIQRIYYDRVTRRIYGDAGQNVDENGVDSKPFALPANESCVAAIDGGLGKAFFACSSLFQNVTLLSFDLATQAPIARVLFSISEPGSTRRMIRWGSDGLAIATDGGLLLYNGAFVH